MLTVERFQEHCTQLIDPNISAEARRELAVEVRDSIELVHSQEYRSFLAHFLPAFNTVLTSLTVPQCFDNPVHKTRAIILEILSRLPHTEPLRDRLLEIFNLAMNVLQRDNEENATTAIHIIFDLHKNFRQHLSTQVQPFLDFVRQLYESFGKTVEVLLLSKVNIPGTQTPEQRRMPLSTQSFKLITECPLLVMFVFQLYPTNIEPNIRRLKPLMVRAIELEVPYQGVSPSARGVYHDLVAAQVKTVSFLAYLLKQNPDYMRGDDMSIPRSVVKLLQACPGSSVLIRKELLVATRHILSSPYRQGFFDQIDVLLDEKVLVGTGRLATETLRPLAYSFLAELVHCVRHNLSIVHLEKIIFLFSTNVHDPRFSYTLQTSSVRLLMNLIEGILKISGGDVSQRAAARELLIRILDTMVAKYVSLGDQVPRLLTIVTDLRNDPDPIQSGKRLSDIPVGDPLKEVADFKTLLRTLTPGLKTVIWSAMNIRITEATSARHLEGSQREPTDALPGSMSNVKKGLAEKECETVSRLLVAGQKCFRLYSALEPANGGTNPNVLDSKQPTPNGSRQPEQSASSIKPSTVDQQSDSTTIVCATMQEERDIFDQFAQIFTVLDVGSFQDVFGLRMADLFEHIVSNPQAIAIPQHFLANSNMSKYFADILLNFLVDNLSLLDVSPDEPENESSLPRRKATALLRMFKILFASVSLFPANEPVLRLHLATIVQKSLKLARDADDSRAYLQMLRAFFKAITSGKQESQFDILYRDFMPLVEPLFDGLLSLYSASRTRDEREIIAELCLMMPARPSTIFPYLEKQLKPIVWALRGLRDNPTYGLRTLEFWVDMLQPSYLDILLSRMEPELTRALLGHLRPATSDLAKSSLRILGKLGSRTREFKFSTTPTLCSDKQSSLHEVSLRVPDGTTIPFETARLVKFISETILERRKPDLSAATPSHLAHSWLFLKACLHSFFPSVEGGGNDVDKWKAFKFVSTSKDTHSTRVLHPTTSDSFRTEKDILSCILTAMISLYEQSELSSYVSSVGYDKGETQNNVNCKLYLCGLVKFFATLTVHEASKRREDHRALRGTDVPSSSTRALSPSIFSTALVRSMCFEQEKLNRSAISCLKEFAEALVLCAKERHVGYGSEHLEQMKNTASNTSMETITNQKMKVPTAVSPTENTAGELPNQTGLESNGQSADPGGANGNSGRTDDQQLQEKLNAQSLLAFERVLSRSVSDVIEQLCHCSHERNWASKRGGALGLHVVVQALPDTLLKSQFFRLSQHHIIRALLTIVRGPSELVTSKILSTAKQLLRQMLVHFPFPPGTSFEVALSSSNMLKDLILRIGYELISESNSARACARENIRFLANSKGYEMADLLKGSKDQLLRTLHSRPLRQHALALQVSYVECFNFFLESMKSGLSTIVLSSPLRDNLLFECMLVLETHTFDAVTEAEEGFRHKHLDSKYDVKTTRLLLVLRRRIMELLCNVSVFCSSQLQQTTNERLFRGMISCFFKSLQSGDPSIVNSAKIGLKQAISKHPKPKELLQQNLRPILGYLADYKKLSIPYLQGLSRVLELFSHWFNVNLGDKLLEHLQRWTEPEKFALLNKWTPGTESRVGAAILDLFHLLPPAAGKFLPQIVQMVVKLEAVLPVAGPGVAHLGLKGAKTSSTSPYRAPLLRYCNQHAPSATNFFLGALSDDRTRQLFFVILRAAGANALRNEVASNNTLLAAGIDMSIPGRTSCRAFHFIEVVDLVSQQLPQWLSSEKELLPNLVKYWNQGFSQILSQAPLTVTLSRVEELERIGAILIRFCKHERSDKISTLFEFLSVYSVRTVSNFSEVKEFLRSVAEASGNHTMRKSILLHFLTMFQNQAVPNERKTHALQYIVVPMISTHLAERRKIHKNSSLSAENQLGSNAQSKRQTTDLVLAVPPSTSSGINPGKHGVETLPPEQNRDKIVSNRNNASSSDKPAPSTTGEQPQTVEKTGQPEGAAPDEVLDVALLQRIMKEILDQPDDIVRSYDELLSAQLLHLATELIRGMPKELERSRKELIKFGWGHLKREDSIAKQWAFVNVTRFFEAYQAPPKIILQVYVALLRVTQAERRELVHQALDILTPALPKRLIHQTADHRYPIWIRYTKKILLEEGHSIPNLVHIWQLIVRHPTLFYVARAQFVPIMANSLNKIGLFGPSIPENKRLALDLVDLIVKWEKQRRNSTTQLPIETTDQVSKKRSRDETKSDDPSRAQKSVGSQNSTEGERANKLRKTSDGNALPGATSPAKSHNPSQSDGDEFCPAQGSLEAIMNFLVQIPFRPMDRRDTPFLTKRCFSLIDEVLQLWPDVNARLGFIEKVISLQIQEKISPQQLGSKSAGNPANGDVVNQDTKGARNEQSRTESRSKRNQLKPFLANALHVFSLFVRRQGKLFIQKNLTSLKAIVGPSIADMEVQIAEQFSSLLDNLLTVMPFVEGNGSGKDVESANVRVQSGGTTAPCLGNPDTKKNQHSACVKSQATTAGNNPTAETLLYTSVHDGIEASLKSAAPLRNLCGLIVLKVFVKASPSIFPAFQDALIKISHRITKDQVNLISQGGSSQNLSAASGLPSRIALTKDTSTSSGVNQGAVQRNSVATDIQATHSNQDNVKRSEESAKFTSTNVETRALKLCLALLGKHVGSLESIQRKTFLQVMGTLIDRSEQEDVLREIIDVVSHWVFESSITNKDSITQKEKLLFLIKMTSFERLTSGRAEAVMEDFLRLIVRIFGGDNTKNRKADIIQKLERAFMMGLKSSNKPLRDSFFKIYDDAVGTSTNVRLNYIFAKQDWEHLSDTLWIKQAVELLISPVREVGPFEVKASSACFSSVSVCGRDNSDSISLFSGNEALCYFVKSMSDRTGSNLTNPLRNLVCGDPAFAVEVWTDLVPKLWCQLTSVEQNALERFIPQLLSKEYHQSQMRWRINSVQALLMALVKLRPLPNINPDVVIHLGSRWNAWHVSLRYLFEREKELQNVISSGESVQALLLKPKIEAELQDVAEAQARMYSMLHEYDFMAGVWKSRTCLPVTKQAISLEQLGYELDAQDSYAEAIASSFSQSSSDVYSKTPANEVTLWEEQWVACATKLCQWDILTEFSRSVLNSSLLYECLWRLPDWNGLKELLGKCPIPESVELKLYQAYVHLQENKLELADSFIDQGYQKALEQVNAFPPDTDFNTLSPTLVQFQKLVELQESSRVFAELNSLSRQGGAGVNIDQKIDIVKGVLNCWRERVPSPKEPLFVWNEVLTWRNHMHAVVVNVLEALKDAANAKVAAAQSSQAANNARNSSMNNLSQTAQIQAAAAIAQALPTQVLVMGVNETAWNVHRFAKTCRKQGFPEVALFSLQKLYPFGTMDLSEYFVKTKETVRSYMAHPRGLEKSLENGLYELNRCNVGHFNSRQKAQLFLLKSKLLLRLGHVKQSRESLLQSLNTSPDVGGAWLEWGRHCDSKQRSLALPAAILIDHKNEDGIARTQALEIKLKDCLLWREAAANCYLQAARFGSRSARPYIARVLRLLTVDTHDRTKVQIGSEISKLGPVNHPGTKTETSQQQSSNGGRSQALKPKAMSTSESSRNPPTPTTSRIDGVAKSVLGLIGDVPAWMWLPWISQLLNMLSRSESTTVRPILVKIGKEYPQALFYSLRSYMEERKPLDKPTKVQYKDVIKLGGPIVPTPKNGPSHSTIARQAQIAKDNFHRTNERYVALKSALMEAEKAVNASHGTAEHSANISRRAQIKSELLSTHRVLERCIQAYRLAHHRQAQVAGQTKQAARPAAQNIQENQTNHPSSKGEHWSGEEGSKKRDLSHQSSHSESPSASRKGSAGGVTDSDVEHSSSALQVSPFEHADFVLAQVIRSHYNLYFDMERIAMELSFRMKPQREEHLLGLMSALLSRCYQAQMKKGKEVAQSYISALSDVSRMCFNTGTETSEAGHEQRLPSSIADLKTAFEKELAPQTAEDFPREHEALIARLRRWQGIFQRRVSAFRGTVKLENVSKHLLDIENSSVDVFGQYTDAGLCEPSPEKHVKIMWFGADVRVVSRPASLSRGIEIIGTDGREYHFVLESGVQPAEEKISQVFRLLNSYMLAKEARCVRKRLQLHPPKMVPTGYRSRLTLSSFNASSLSEALQAYLERQGKDMDDAVVTFRKLSFDACNRLSKSGEQHGLHEMIRSRLAAYDSMCEEHVPAYVLRDWVETRMRSEGHLFLFRKKFAETLASGSIVSYCLGVGARRPETMLVDWDNGVQYNLNMRALTSPNGIIESDEAVPFRLTRNVVNLLGKCGLEGAYFGAMGNVLRTLAEDQDGVVMLAEVVLRDELGAWAQSRGSSGADNARATESRLQVSMEKLRTRVGCRNQDVRDVAACTNQLIELAQKKENLAHMETAWQAWF